MTAETENRPSANAPQAELDGLVQLYSQSRWDEAIALLQQLLRTYPDCEITHNIGGVVVAAAGDQNNAIPLYDRAIALAPDYVEAFNNRGNALRALGKMVEALADFDTAIALWPDYVEARINRAIVLRGDRRYEEALGELDAAIGLNPNLPQAYTNKGNVLQDLNRYDEAVAEHRKAIALDANFVAAHVNLGSSLLYLLNLPEAIESYETALTLSPGHAMAYRNLGTALIGLRRLPEALVCLEKSFELDDRDEIALGEVLFLRAKMCLWLPDGLKDELRRRVAQGAGIAPFHVIALFDDPALELENARNWSRKHIPPRAPLPASPIARGERIRIGYFSSDFHNHATMALMIKMLELHDKQRFEIHAFSYGQQVQDPMRERVIQAVDHFHDISRKSDDEAARLARDLGIHVALDLKGHTEGTRMGIFATRAAPRQISYLGYPGTIGSPAIDYAIADRIVIPEHARRFYVEDILHMPHSYQVTDDERPIADRTFTRSELGLPEEGFVFCCFNGSFKITQSVFDIWARLLARVSGSVFWLLADNPAVIENLRREAEARGIDPNRLIFAERMPVGEHLARQTCADLFLDTFNYNAHTTTSDALWAGLPVVTKLGESFAARVSGGLLQAVGLPELVTDSEQSYEDLAFALATDRERLRAIKAKLAANRSTQPLFDTERFTRSFEQLIVEATG